MRVLVQRVTQASVTVGGQEISRISSGLLALVGVTHTDTAELARRLAQRVVALRVLAGQLSVVETGAELLVVSQFTLYGTNERGRRPSYLAAAPAATAEPIVDAFAAAAAAAGVRVATGRFGAEMQVALVNDGPLTLLLEK